MTFPEKTKVAHGSNQSSDLRCDNRLFERCLEHQMPRTRSKPTYASVVAKPFSREAYNASPANTPTLIEINTTRCRGPLPEEEKQQRRANRLCLYCGEPGHVAVNCPHRPRRQVNQIAASTNSTKPESISLGMSDSHNIPSLSNKFVVLSKLGEELNDQVQPK